MGCDIHCFIEVKKLGAWENLNTFEYKEETSDFYLKEMPMGRDYELFGVLAGVRDRSYPIIAGLRGFPADASQELKYVYDFWNPYGHSCSWLTMAEVHKAMKDKEKYPRERNEYSFYPIGKKLKKFYKKVKSIVAEEQGYFHPEDTRVVFWFDN